MELDTLYYRLKSLTAYRGLLKEPVLAAALDLLARLTGRQGPEALDAWAELVSSLGRAGSDGLGPGSLTNCGTATRPGPTGPR